MDMKAMLEKAHADTMHHASLMLATQELESATYAARQAREKLRRATRNRLQAKERHADAKLNRSSSDRSRVRVDVARWALENAERDEHDALNDYRDALKRLEVLGGTVSEADSHEVPGMVRHRARKAIALADAFGNKVAMDATLHDGLERPVLPELEPEVEVQDLRVIDPLEPVEARTAPESRAVLVPVEEYACDPAERPQPDEDPDDDGAAIPAGERLETEAERFETEAERFAFWREVNHAQEDDAEKALEATREGDEGDEGDEGEK